MSVKLMFDKRALDLIDQCVMWCAMNDIDPMEIAIDVNPFARSAIIDNMVPFEQLNSGQRKFIAGAAKCLFRQAV